MPFRKVRNGYSPWASPFIGGVNYTINAKVTNTITVGIQLKDAGSRGGANLTQRALVEWYITTDPNGDTPAVSSGGVAAGARGNVQTLTTGKNGLATSNATGGLDIAVTQTTGVTLYLMVIVGNRIFPTAALVF